MLSSIVVVKSAAVIPLVAGSSELRSAYRTAGFPDRLRSLLLIAPLGLLLIATFLGPIAFFLVRAVDNRQVSSSLPTTGAALQSWDGVDLPVAQAYAALLADLRALGPGRESAILARRLNYEIPGFRALVLNAAAAAEPLSGQSAKDFLLQLDSRWGEPKYWHVLRRNFHSVTPFFLLTSIDLGQDDRNAIVRVPAERAIFLPVIQRTLIISTVVTIACLLLAFPVARVLSGLPSRLSNLLLIFVLLPFWTSLLVRTAAWIILLGQSGPINSSLLWLGLIDHPLQLIFNRFAVYVAMTHVLLPFMILPIYSVMKNISPSYMRAAASLGAPPFRAFVDVFLPQALPGIAAGCLLVFILALGYYITPSIVGGTSDQMISYFIAFYTDGTANWGLSAALGTILLTLSLALYAVYAQLIGIDKMRLG